MVKSSLLNFKLEILNFKSWKGIDLDKNPTRHETFSKHPIYKFLNILQKKINDNKNLTVTSDFNIRRNLATKRNPLADLKLN